MINPAYDTVLEVQKLYKEDTLTEFEKIDQALKMLVRNKWNLRLLNPEEKQKLLSVITKRYVEVEKRPQIKKSPYASIQDRSDRRTGKIALEKISVFIQLITGGYKN